MGPTSTEVQALHRASIVRVLGHRTGKVELVQGHGTVEYVLWRQGHRVLVISIRVQWQGSRVPAVSVGVQWVLPQWLTLPLPIF